MKNIHIIMAMIFCCLLTVDTAKAQLCSNTNNSCYETRVSTATNNAGRAMLYSNSTFDHSTDQCIYLNGTGNSYVQDGGDVYILEYRSRFNAGSFGAWEYAGALSGDPGEPPEMANPTDYPIDACADVRPPPPPPAVCTPADTASAINECGNDNYTLYEKQGVTPEEKECAWQCGNNDCNEDYQQLKDFCAYGIKKYDWNACSGTCQDCNDARGTVEDICRDKGGVYSFICGKGDIVNSLDPAERKVNIRYRCSYAEPQSEPPAPPTPASPTDSGTPTPAPDPPRADKPDPTAPHNTPTPNPTTDPAAPTDQKQLDYTISLKTNSDKQTIQGAEQTKELSSIVDQTKETQKNTSTTANNTEKIANNQGKLQKEINNSGKNTAQGLQDLKKSNTTGFDKIAKAIGGISGNTTNVGSQSNTITTTTDNSTHTGIESVDFSSLATSDSVPTLSGNEFDSLIPNDNDYNEHNDSITLGTDTGNAYITKYINPQVSPVNAHITASGSPCLSGTVTIHNKNTPVSICFNKPWMLQGYAIMKIIFIAIAYLQTAMLLNKALK